MKPNYKRLFFTVLIIYTIFLIDSAFAVTNLPENEKILTSQNTISEIVGFSNNILLSTNDDNYAHHVEPTLAIGDDSVLFAGWKNSETHNGGGARVSVSKSIDGGATWSEPFDMPMFNGKNTRQSDPWLVWHEGMIYYAYLEFELAYFDDFDNSNIFRK